MLDEVDVRFIVLASPIDCTQGRVDGGKNGVTDLKCLHDSALWVLPGELNAMKTVLVVAGDLPQYWVRSTCDSSYSPVPLITRKAVLAEKKLVD
jgi:hypothetical protein